MGGREGGRRGSKGFYNFYSDGLYFCVLADKYTYLINGEAEHEIEAFIAEKHSFDEYAEVSFHICPVVELLCSKFSSEDLRK